MPSQRGIHERFTGMSVSRPSENTIGRSAPGADHPESGPGAQGEAGGVLREDPELDRPNPGGLGGGDQGVELRGMTGDRCPCPHWWHVVKGRFPVRYANHEEIVETGDAYYLPPGHAPLCPEDTEMFEVSPAEALNAITPTVVRV
ncbi:hypothetical protein AB0L44_40265 [Nonomuraea wenchangensis]|uniref:hypothetical protein n=1 Tax=Nonomuraea wenchangensis TaxID=568860 RepID=UPI0034346756